ncbi:hypothetical protein FB382_001186 [Nocardioides ginsengisegetis]|uniref:WD40-like Beta Propeller Repeat n=1 Tax=Nocardioides ginsengisegetis TaxID=661491 RepID=A0A7W3IYD4_9ACTN|nr:hypothetical protein [Nocardioides ginsengisegetis]MBA8802895.1 hypothetical protein [Nocardioides ginsengisegetis]
MDVPAARRTRTLLLGMAAATAAAVLPWLPAAADPPHIDSATLPRGDNPAVALLVRDTIRDGALRVPATTRGRHDALWEVAGGYLVRDVNVGPRHLTRVVYIAPTGKRRVVARSPELLTVAVSGSGRRVAIQRTVGSDSLRSVITVSRPRTGKVLAHRELRHANLVALTDHRALVGIRARWHHPATVWWNYPADTLRRVYHQAAVGADLRHDKVVFDRNPVGEFCNRVALLSHPAHTLWHSCRIYPHQWSPDGRHALATHTYFDAAGTDRWWVIQGRTAARQARITGRLDWDAVWEDDGHFLTLAQSDAGRAAVIRCDLAGTCERASRLWDVPVPADPSVYYAAPPVVLAGR